MSIKSIKLGKLHINGKVTDVFVNPLSYTFSEAIQFRCEKELPWWVAFTGTFDRHYSDPVEAAIIHLDNAEVIRVKGNADEIDGRFQAELNKHNALTEGSDQKSANEGNTGTSAPTNSL